MKEENEFYGLAYNCPTQQRMDDCPFMHLERLSFIQKVNWIDGLNKNVKQKIIEEHKNCSKKRF